MNKERFNLLPLAEKVEWLWDHGEVIAERAYYDCNITLFLVDGIFVEVFFHRIKEEIIGAEIQGSDDILYGYVNDLDLSELIKLLQ